jgi:hypothetical protein
MFNARSGQPRLPYGALAPASLRRPQPPTRSLIAIRLKERSCVGLSCPEGNGSSDAVPAPVSRPRRSRRERTSLLAGRSCWTRRSGWHSAFDHRAIRDAWPRLARGRRVRHGEVGAHPVRRRAAQRAGRSSGAFFRFCGCLTRCCLGQAPLPPEPGWFLEPKWDGFLRWHKSPLLAARDPYAVFWNVVEEGVRPAQDH